MSGTGIGGATGRLRAIRAILTLLALTVSASAASGQEPRFDPFAGQGADRYRVDLERLFFASPRAEQEARAALVERARRMVAAHSSPPRSGLELERLMFATDTVRRISGKHLAYLTLRSNLDTRDQASSAAADALSDSIGRALNAVLGPLAGMPEAQLRGFIAERPALRRFAFAIRQMRRTPPSAPDATAAALVAGPLTRWQSGLFWSLIGETDWGTVQAPEGLLDVRRQGGLIYNHADRAVREAGHRLNVRGRSRHRDSYYILMRGNVQSRNALARLRGFRDFREESYGNLNLRTEEVGALLEAIARRGEVNRRYETVRSAHLAAAAHLDTVHVWDLTLPEPGMKMPRFTVPEASAILREAMAPLGPEYARELALLLDPRNGRLDLAPRENRSPRPGFSTGSVGYPSVFFQGRYEGFVPDLFIFAHEIGHGVQNGLMDANGVAATNAGGPSYFTESFAGFTELLLADHLYRTAPDRPSRIYYLQAFLERATGLFDNARAAHFEHLLYDSIPAGGVASADAAERLMQGLGARYSVLYGERSERPDQWINHIHYFTWPLYRINYVYSTLLALKYFELYSRDSQRFVAGYNRLLANGYDDEPNALLRRFLGFGLGDPGLVDGAASLIEARTAELERLYAGT